MAYTEHVEVEVVSWGKHQIRGDIKRPSWFRCNHDIFEDDKLWELSREELCFFFYVLCLASKNNKAKFLLSIEKAAALGQFKKQVVRSALEKLNVTGTLRVRYVSVRERTSTLHNNTIHIRESTELTPEPSVEVVETTKQQTTETVVTHKLVEIWNACGGSLPKVRSLTVKRKRLADAAWSSRPDAEHWTSVITRMSRTKFLNGENARGWKAGFDFFLNPDNLVKIEEGTYDSGVSGPKLITF